MSAERTPPREGCSVAAYAAAKQLPEAFLRSLGLTDIVYDRAPAVRIPYFGPDGSELAVQFRTRLEKGPDGDDRFRWKSGDRPCLYGLNRLGAAREAGAVALVEGASDCQTLWYHGEPALGLPGANSWREDWAPLLEGLDTIYVVVEPDRGGEATLAWVGKSKIRHRVRLVRGLGANDPSALYLADPARFQERWRAALAAAEPWTVYEGRRLDEARAADWQQCAALARTPRLLDHVARVVERTGVVGEARAVKLLYLVVTSRRLQRLASAVVKGPSSAGKSFLVERVLALFPDDAYYALSSMSERALAYSEEPLAHRMLVLYEAAGLAGDFATYLVRSLLSEGRIRYETVEKTKAGLRPRLIEREGPTGLLVTTTQVSLHPENETRLLSIPVSDTPEQTARILRQLAQVADEAPDESPDLTAWRALQRWLAAGPTAVVIPFARRLAEAIPPVAVRLRRDFGMLLTLIRAHALLHQAQRGRDARGRIAATIEDYAVVRELVADLFADTVEATVAPTIRETVEAVARLTAHADEGVEVLAVARVLGIDKAPAWRRVRVALDRGYLRNLEERKGRPARLVLGEPLPEDRPLLPEPETLLEAERGEGGVYTCANAGNRVTDAESSRDGAALAVADPEGRAPNRATAPAATVARLRNGADQPATANPASIGGKDRPVARLPRSDGERMSPPPPSGRRAVASEEFDL